MIKIERKVLFFCLFFLAAAHFPAQAAGVVGDGTPASCTEAALNAALSGGGNVSFNCGPDAHTITITSEKVITADTTLNGGNLITLNGGGTTRIFRVTGGAGFTVQNITLTNGYTAQEGGGIYVEEQGSLTVENSQFSNCVSTQTAENYAGGGAISVERQSTAVITNSTFTNNQAGNGGAIAIGGWNADDNGGTLTVGNSTFNNNTATEDGGIPGGGDGGGAIYLKGGVAAFITDSTFTNNTAPNGGAIHLLQADVTITDSTFNNNIAQHNFSGGGGGAIYMDGGKNLTGGLTIQTSTFSANQTNKLGGAIFSFPEGTETTTIGNSTFEGNLAHGQGMAGAIYHQSAHGTGPLEIEGSTFAYNDAYSTVPGGASQGGALWLYTAPVTIRNSTFYANDASDLTLPADDWHRGFGGAIVTHTPTEIINSTIAYNTSGFVGGGVSAAGGVAMTVHNTIIAHNDGANPWGIQENCTGSLVDGGNNLQFPAGECLSGSNADPLLGVFGEHGGETETLPLLPGSPAIDAGNPATCPPVDQRGMPRQGAACDIGAFEFDTGPILMQMYPAMMAVSEAQDFTLTLTGAGFTPQSVVRWQGAARPTTYHSFEQVTAVISASDVNTVGEFAVTVYDPEGEEESAVLLFRVVAVQYNTYLPLMLQP